MPKVLGPTGLALQSNVPITTTLAYITVNGAKVWVQGTDPAGSAADGDVWIDNTP